jgi:DNA-binding CsgD family transcriptional regulator
MNHETDKKGELMSQANQIDNHVDATAAEAINLEVSREPKLTKREREVLTLLAEGLSSKEIAKKFNIDSKTVDVHRAIIRKKLGIFNLPGLVKYALRIGLVTLDK